MIDLILYPIQAYIYESDGLKNWGFIKNHTHVHMFDDIIAKGVTRNYNTKYNESMHKGPKESFQRRIGGHFQAVAEQVRGNYCGIETNTNAYVDITDSASRSLAPLCLPYSHADRHA